MDGDSTRPSMKGLGIPAASRLPVAEGETLAVGVSTRMLGVMDVGSLRIEASQSPEGERPVWTVESETLADGVSTRVLGVMDGGSLRTVEDTVLAVGVSTRAISVMVGFSMSSRRKELVTGTQRSPEVNVQPQAGKSLASL